MLDFISSVFKGIVSVIIVIALIAVLIGGCIMLSNSFWLALLVWVGGFIAIVLSFGLISIFIEMNENLKILILRTGNTSTGNASSSGIHTNEKKICPRCKKDFDGDYSGCPHCGFSFSGNNKPISYGNIPKVVSLSKKKCSKCKKEINDDVTKCPYCGNDSFE
jgi:RNA polymerase subunit RPABC4/transcription elongation factor Spt4